MTLPSMMDELLRFNEHLHIMKIKDFSAAQSQKGRPKTRRGRKAALNHRMVEAVYTDVGDVLSSGHGDDDAALSAAGEEDPGAALEFMKPHAI